jgi:tetratricopeptide (TPR) repeat protein
MNLLTYILFTVFIIFCNSTGIAETKKASLDEIRQTIIDNRREIERTNESVKEIRRDQLNYHIEKDLLKETYSSNIQTINIVIALILGTLTIIGVLGVKSMGALQKEFREELEILRQLKDKYETKFNEIANEQKQAELKIVELRTTNEDQNKRLQVLEMQEKVASLINSKNYDRALDYLAIGLDLSKDDTILLLQKADCLSKLGRLGEALTTYEALLKIEPDNLPTISNYCEFALILGDLPKFENTYQPHKEKIEKIYGIYLSSYFESLHVAQKGQSADLKKIVTDLVQQAPNDKVQRIKDWNFDDYRRALGLRTEPIWLLSIKFIDFLDGKISKEELLASREYTNLQVA